MLLPLLVLLVMVSSAAKVNATSAQVLSESQIKAGFLFNFTRFIEWPDHAFATPTSAFSVCIIGATPLVDLLTQAAMGKVVNGRSLTIRGVKSTDDLHTCQILFLSMTEERRAAHILESVKGMSVLTVSEIPGFAAAGGMIDFVVEENKVKLEMNVDATSHTGLKVSAKLIAVSHLVSGHSSIGGHE